MHTYTRTYTHKDAHTRTNVRTHPRTHTHIHTNKHTKRKHTLIKDIEMKISYNLRENTSSYNYICIVNKLVSRFTNTYF